MSFSLRVHIGGDLEQRDRAIADLVDWTIAQDVIFVSKHPELPGIYSSGVKYATPECTAETCEDLAWESPDLILARGFGDCKSLAAWRIAELRVRHRFPALPVVQRRVLSTGDVLYHVAVTSGGRIEDPSLILGMR